jgi:murein tripeptide amidase MpaA
MWLYYWERYGLEKASQLFKNDYIKDQGHIKKGEPNLVNVLDGKLQYLKMVKGNNDSTYRKLKNRFENLAGPIDPINSVLNTWEENGIEKAMQLFYQRNSR